MAPSFSVRMSGTVLSSLLYECANALGDVEGFLIGTMVSQTTNDITDQSETTTPIVKTWAIVQSYYCLSPDLPKPYNSQGDIQIDAIKHQLAYLGGPEAAIGYFRFRRQTRLTLSARETAFMKSCASLPDSPLRCMAIITASLGDNEDPSTHSYGYGFWDMASQDRIPCDIINLSETTLSYQNFIPSIPGMVSPDILNAMNPDAVVDQYEKMYKKATECLYEAAGVVMRKESEFLQLQREVDELEKAIARQGHP